ncbi:MAG TPA: hypothetical protein VI564_05100 [Candidatus Nanoarchaeia archaeon]|nr:hypothetical protein [Candidatus Nanoarchaeia archaeon]
MKYLCIKTIIGDKGEMIVNICKMVGKCENKNCGCKHSRRLEEQNEEMEIKF